MTKPVDHLEILSRHITLGAFAVAAGIFIITPLIALEWRQHAFPGFLVDHTLVVNSRDGRGWTGRVAGIAPPEVVTRLGGVTVKSTEDYHRALDNLQPGVASPIFTVLPDGRSLLYPAVESIEFALGDFVSMFWLPYLIGLAYLAIGGWLYWASGQTRPGRALSFFCVCVSISAALLFDVLSSHALTFLWILALSCLGGALISLSLRFPVEWPPVHRRPWLLAIPYLVSLGLAGWNIIAARTPEDPWAQLASRSASYQYTALACLFFLGMMLIRARFSSRAGVRRRARVVLVGAFVAFLPTVAWFLAPLAGLHPSFNSALLLPSLIIFPLAVATAILRYRLLEIDTFVNRAIVYAVLTAVLAGFIAAMISISQRLFVAVTGERSDAAIVITTLIVVTATTPLKNRIQNWMDRQFRELPSAELKDFGEQVEIYHQLAHPETLTRRFLEESVRTLGAESGAWFRFDGDQPVLAHHSGSWRGNALVSVPLLVNQQCVGLLMLGPRKNGRPYRRQDVEALSAVSNKIAFALGMERAEAMGAP